MSSLHFKERFNLLQATVETRVHGKPEAVRLALTCLFAEGNLLIEDVPGVAKTLLAKTIAGSIEGGTYQRIQFTPDLLPTDITGVEIFNPGTGRFDFRPGPVFANVLIGDEINRAAPRTQSALLQAMAEGEVTVGRTTHQIRPPFFCVATQNPIEHRGTYDLPEAQLDRFLMRITIGYPAPHDEKTVLVQGITGASHEPVTPVLHVDEIGRLVSAARAVPVGEAVQDYLVRIATATRISPAVHLGVSPRGTIALAAAARVVAASWGRQFTSPDDVKEVAIPVLAHRLILTQEALMQGLTATKVIQDVINTVPVPRHPGGDR